MGAVTYQILAVTTYMFEDYAGIITIIVIIFITITNIPITIIATMSTAAELTPADVAKSVIVIMAFISVWAFVVVLVGIQVSVVITISIAVSS
jgi:hypothetical protein